MKKVAKNCIIGAIIYGACQLFYDMGKGYMLGVMAKYNDDYSPVEVIDLCRIMMVSINCERNL